MSATASSLSIRSAQSLSTRNAGSLPAQARGVDWGRYAELFAYDETSETFSLENPQ